MKLLTLLSAMFAFASCGDLNDLLSPPLTNVNYATGYGSVPNSRAISFATDGFNNGFSTDIGSLTGKNIENGIGFVNEIGAGLAVGGGTVKQLAHPVPVPIPQPYPIAVTKQIAIPVPVPKPVSVLRPVPVPIPQPVPISVSRPVPTVISRPIAVPVQRPVYFRIPFPVQVPVSQPYPIIVPQPYSVRVPLSIGVSTGSAFDEINPDGLKRFINSFGYDVGVRIGNGVDVGGINSGDIYPNYYSAADVNGQSYNGRYTSIHAPAAINGVNLEEGFIPSKFERNSFSNTGSYTSLPQNGGYGYAPNHGYASEQNYSSNRGYKY